MFSYRWSRRCWATLVRRAIFIWDEGQHLGHVFSRCSRKGRNMWGLSPLTTLLLFSIFTAVHSEEKPDVGKGAIVRARLEVCTSSPHL